MARPQAAQVQRILSNGATWWSMPSVIAKLSAIRLVIIASRSSADVPAGADAAVVRLQPASVGPSGGHADDATHERGPRFSRSPHDLLDPTIRRPRAAFVCRGLVPRRNGSAPGRPGVRIAR